ncbi:hypothetical protein APHCR_1402 [Anaplasma phagocytophilum str. CR1007]|nr:hypothetical protein APHCR_1401 [Anaplasma phagocytophilum str. CR1007]KKA00784.1 hypothetical protein APHCR_1402 [Anaplasma phagocytophilum str. CR1007]
MHHFQEQIIAGNAANYVKARSKNKKMEGNITTPYLKMRHLPP